MATTSRGIGQAGTLESCDARVTVELLDDGDVAVVVEGPMKAVFGDAVRTVALERLAARDLRAARVTVVDRGALDYVLRARIDCAIDRAMADGEETA